MRDGLPLQNVLALTFHFPHTNIWPSSKLGKYMSRVQTSMDIMSIQAKGDFKLSLLFFMILLNTLVCQNKESRSILDYYYLASYECLLNSQNRTMIIYHISYINRINFQIFQAGDKEHLLTIINDITTNNMGSLCYHSNYKYVKKFTYQKNRLYKKVEALLSHYFPGL